MNPEKRLRTFVISRFILVMPVVMIAEVLLTAFINNVIIPAATMSFFPELKGLNLGSLTSIIQVTLMPILFIFTGIAGNSLPVDSGWIFRILSSAVSDLGLSRISDSKSIASFYADIPGAKRIGIIAFLISIFIILILPVIISILWYSFKVTERLNLIDRERELMRQEEERKRYLMISDIVHDLKTPMTTVSGYAKALSDGMVPEKDRDEYLKAISLKTERMNEIILLLLDYVKLDSEGFSITPSQIDLSEFLRTIAAEKYTDIEAAGDELDIDIPEEEIPVKADARQFSRVINNLIANAVKHNPKGTSIGVFLKDDEYDLRILIADSGKLIDNDFADKIFDPFVTGDKSRSSSGGTGLGLSVSKKICKLHKFDIKLVQKPDTGRFKLDPKYNKVFVITIEKI